MLVALGGGSQNSQKGPGSLDESLEEGSAWMFVREEAVRFWRSLRSGNGKPLGDGALDNVATGCSILHFGFHFGLVALIVLANLVLKKDGLAVWQNSILALNAMAGLLLGALSAYRLNNLPKALVMVRVTGVLALLSLDLAVSFHVPRTTEFDALIGLLTFISALCVAGTVHDMVYYIKHSNKSGD